MFVPQHEEERIKKMIDAKTFADITELTRDEKREIWMTRQGISLAALCVVVGCTVSTLSKHLRNETIPVEHHLKLVRFGVPAELLPLPVDQKRGPKPRNAMPMTALAQAQ
jgi:DNA-binding CsgD family transcriptional regulator